MKRPTAILLLAASIAAGFFLLKAGEGPEPVVDTSAIAPSGPGVPGSASKPVPVEPEGSSEPAATPPPPISPAATPPAATGSAPIGNADELRNEAHRLLERGQVAPAVDALKKAVELDPSARNHGELGDLLVKLTAMDKGLYHLRRAAALEPSNADRWIALANAWYLKPNPGEAWKAEKKAKEVEPGLELGRDAHGLRTRKRDSAADDQ